MNIFAFIAALFFVTAAHSAAVSPPSAARFMHGFPASSNFDINAALAGGAASAATGDNAVAAAADDDSGVVGVIGENTALGAAAPGAAIGFGFGSLFNPSAGSQPAATPAAANIFNLFN